MADPTAPVDGVLRVQNAYYATSDVAATARFYREGLGLQERFRDGDRWVQFGVGGVNVAVACPEEAAQGQQGACVVFEVADLAAMCERVTQHGGTVVAERDMGSHGRTVTVRDPGGNILQLLSRGPHPGG